MRRDAVIALIIGIVSAAIVGSPRVGLAPSFAEEKSTEEKAATEAKDESAKKDDAASSTDGQSASEKNKEKDAKKPAASEAEKDKKPATEESAKDKEKSTAKTDEKTAAKPEAKKRKTFKVESKRLKIDVAVDGAFVARKMDEVPLRPDVWTDYEITEVVDHGAKVHKGEVLVKFDAQKINEAVDDLELEQRLNELAIERAEEEMPRIEKTLKMDFEDADRTNENAKEDLARYNEIDRPMALKSADFMIKYYNFMLDYEKDELDQLEKMYKADDLTEATEEIVLKRQRNSVEFAEFSLENAKINSDEMVKYRIPRMDIRIKEATERAAMAKARAQMALAIDLNRARYELEQRKKARTKSLDKHSKLLTDRGLMEIKAPADGVVFYGQCVNGRWSDTPSLINKYKPHNNVSPGSILMTVVESRPLYVTSTIDEGKRPEISDGQKARITLPAEGADHVGCDVKSISPIPVSSGKFEINFDVKQDEIPDWVVPGMSCKVQITTYDKKDVIVVPKKAVHDDKDDPDQHYVWLVDPKDEEAKPERRDVKLGKRKDDEVEILKGLKKGDVISLEDEEAKAKEKEASKE
jgi:HlyD family secretion protein